jgi:hypothetical protein
MGLRHRIETSWISCFAKALFSLRDTIQATTKRLNKSSTMYRHRYTPRCRVGSLVMSQVQTSLGRLARSRGISRIEEVAIGNLSMKTRASAIFTTMRNIKGRWQECDECRRFFGEEEFKSAFDDPMNTPRY